MAKKDLLKDKGIQETYYTKVDGSLIPVSIEHIKTAYIVEGLSIPELAARFGVNATALENIISTEQLDKVRAAHIKHGLALLQNVQIGQAQQIIDLEAQFKKIRLIQLENVLNDYMAYFSKYKHFYKVHPVTGEILKDTNGIPMQIKIPNVSKEIAELKESLSLSEGLKNMLRHIDDIINTPKKLEDKGTEILDIESFDSLFEKKKLDAIE